MFDTYIPKLLAKSKSTKICQYLKNTGFYVNQVLHLFISPHIKEEAIDFIGTKLSYKTGYGGVNFLSKQSLNLKAHDYVLSQTERNMSHMKGLPSVNAIIPICNWANRLELCLQRLVTQIYGGEFKITVVDCGSSDNTREIAREFGCEVIIKENAPVEGLIGLTNHGLKHSKSDLIWKVDADNIMADSTILNKLVKPFLDDPEVNLSVPRQVTNHGYNSFTNYLTLREMIPYDSMVSRSIIKEGWNLVEDMWYGVYNSTVMRRSAIDRVGGWDQDIRVLGRMRSLHLSRAALVQEARYYHDQRVDPVTYMKKISRRLRYFGSMDPSTASEYFVKIPAIEHHKADSFKNLKKEIFRSLQTGGKRSVSDFINECLYQGATLLSLLSSPVSAYRVARKGFYR